MVHLFQLQTAHDLVAVVQGPAPFAIQAVALVDKALSLKPVAQQSQPAARGGPGGTRLAGRFLMSAISTGGPEQAYHTQGRNRFEITELLAPFNQTAYLCSMAWLAPFVIYSGRRMSPAENTFGSDVL